MKRLLWCCLWLVASVGAIAQVPSFKSFNPTQFSTNNFIISVKDGAPLTNVNGISTINLNGTNIVNLFAPASLTNQFHWTNDLNVLKPISGTSVQVTNLTAFQTLASAGAFILDATGATTLDLGTNCVSALQQGGLALSGQTTDPNDTTFNIDGGNFSGHLMFILNAADNSAFTFLNGSAFCDGTPGAFVRLNGDWITQTKGDGLLLYNFNGSLWTEVGRFSGSTNIVTGDNVWENVLAGNIQPVHGNENNVLHFTSGLSNNATNIAMRVGTTNLWDASGSLLAAFHNAGTNQFVLGPTGEIAIGRGIDSFFGGISDGEALVSLRDATLGEPDGNQIDLITLTADGQNRARLVASGNGTSFTLTHKGTARVDLQPGVTSTGSSVAHFIDTSNMLTNGESLFEIRNAGVNQTIFSANGGGIAIGRSTEGFYGLAENGTSIAAVNNVANGDPAVNTWFATTTLTSNGQDSSGYFSQDIYTNRIVASWLVPTNNATSGWSLETSLDGEKQVSLQGSVDNEPMFTFDATVPQIVWGPGTTNVLHRSGRNLIYTNSNPGNISFSSLNGSAAGVSIGTDTGGNPFVSGSTATLYIDQSGGSDGLVLNNSAFGVRTAGTLDNGQFSTAWATLSITNAVLWQMTGVATNLLLDTYTQGTPEGSKTSLPGSVVRDVTNGDLYVKKTGTGSTGYLKVATTGTGAGDQTEYLDADETENTTTPNALALSATVTAAGKYAFTLTVFVDNSTDADGACIDFDGGSATMTSFRAQTKVFDTALGLSSNSTALATDLCVATLTGAGSFEVSGGFTVNAGGTFIPRFFMNAATTGTLSAFRNSILTVTAAN